MKARVRETGDVVNVKKCDTPLSDYIDEAHGVMYAVEQLEIVSGGEPVKWRMELTERQFNAIVEGLDVYGRLVSGQLSELRRLTQDGYKLGSPEIRAVKERLFPELEEYEHYGWDGGGCKDDFQRKKIAQLYQIAREMEHKRTIADGLHNVYSSPTLHSDLADPPIIERIVAEDEKVLSKPEDFWELADV